MLNTSNDGVTRDAAEAECPRHLEVELIDPLDERRPCRRLEVQFSDGWPKIAVGMMICAGRARRRAVGRIRVMPRVTRHRLRVLRAGSGCSGTPAQRDAPRQRHRAGQLEALANGMSFSKSSQNRRVGESAGSCQATGSSDRRARAVRIALPLDARRRRTPARPGHAPPELDVESPRTPLARRDRTCRGCASAAPRPRRCARTPESARRSAGCRTCTACSRPAIQLWLIVVVRLWKLPRNQQPDTDRRGSSSCCTSSAVLEVPGARIVAVLVLAPRCRSWPAGRRSRSRSPTPRVAGAAARRPRRCRRR